jgi:hypothetical protein
MTTTTMTMKGEDDQTTTTRRTPPWGKIRKESQGKEEGSASVKEVHCAAIQVDDRDAAFLFIAEATIATTTALLSTVTSGALSSLGVGMTTIIPELLLS